jgi:ABC-type transporter Mla maintaining outer membrane lipid asymmetry permease subunit MlaE
MTKTTFRKIGKIIASLTMAGGAISAIAVPLTSCKQADQIDIQGGTLKD